MEEESRAKDDAGAQAGASHPASTRAATATDGPTVPTRGREEDDPGARWVAALLAVAAILAAILATRTALRMDDANDAWQSGIREQIKRSLAVLEDIRYVYGVEAEQAFSITTHEVMADALEARASSEPAAIAAALRAEASVHQRVVDQIKPEVEFLADTYALAGGGYDTGARLADRRSRSPDLLALDPAARERVGDDAAEHARGLVLAAVPVGAALFVGSLAMPYRRQRRLLLTLGWLSLLVASASAVWLELAP